MQRDVTVDIMKGIGILTVVIGHTNMPMYVVASIYSFHMPLFFFLAGLFFSERKDKDLFNLLVKLFNDFIVPIGAVVVFYAGMQMILNQFDIMTDDPMLSGVFKFGTKTLDTYWYLGCYFCVYLYFYAVHNKVANWAQRRLNCRLEGIAHVAMVFYFMIFLACLYAAWLIFDGYPEHRLWEAVALNEDLILLIRIGFGAFFYYLGAYFAMIKGVNYFSPAHHAVALVFFAAGFGACFFLAGDSCRFSMQIMHFYNIYTVLFTSVCGIGIVYCLAAVLMEVPALRDFFAMLGRESFAILSHHVFSFILLNIFFMNIGLATKNNLDDPYFELDGGFSLLYLFVGVAYPLLFSRALNQMKKKLFSPGRRAHAH